MMVRENLHAFLLAYLRRTRRRVTHLPLFIDAICVDQGSAIERNHQVSMMGDIYRSAAEVIVWLGPDIFLDSVPMRCLVWVLASFWRYEAGFPLYPYMRRLPRLHHQHLSFFYNRLSRKLRDILAESDLRLLHKTSYAHRAWI